MANSANFEASLKIKAGVEGINEVNRLAKSIEKAGVDVTRLRTASDHLQNKWDSLSTDKQVAELQALTNEAQRLQAIADARIVLGIDTDDKTRAELERVNEAYQTLLNGGTLSNQEVARATQLHTKRVAELEEKLGQTAPTLKNVTEEFGKVVTAAGGLTYVAKEAMAFETAMSGVKKVVDGTPEQIGALSEKIKDMAVNMGMTTTEIAEIAAQGGQLGIPIEQLDKFTEMAAKMATAFGMTAEQAGDAAAKMANVWGIPIQQVEELGDAINTLGNNTAAKESEIVDVMQRIGGQSKQFGLVKEEAAALASAFISLGKAPEVAGTAINALLTKLSTASVQGDGFKQALNGIGLSAEKLAQDINENPQQALENFLQTLSKLDKDQRSVATFKLFGQEYVDDVNALVGGLSTYQNALDLVKDKTANAGAMQAEFEAKMATTEQSLAKAKTSISVLAQTVGQHLLPAISMAAGGFVSMATAVSDFAESHPHITQFVTLIASAQVAMVALNSTMRLMGSVGLSSFTRVATGATTATTAVAGTTTAMTRLNTAITGIAKSATALTGVFMVFNAIGGWAYENIDVVQNLGDHLASIPAAIHSIATTGSLDQFNQNFEMGASRAKDLKNATDDVKKATEENAQAQANATVETQKQADANRQLINEIKRTEAGIISLQNKLAEMQTQGQKNTESYQQLSTELQNSKDKLELLNSQATQANLGEALKTDLQKASGAFEALGVDIDEFATGIDSKTNQALNAFVEVAQLAEGDTRKLALAYNAAKDAAGDNQQAQDALTQKLFQVTEGNGDLSRAVLATAQAQRDAKSASEEQAQALDALGVSMDAVNQGMSKSGLDMVKNLQTGIVAIKEQATSAESLKTALQQAFDTSIASAKTKEDFTAIQNAIQSTGVASQLTAQQMQILNAGMQGGANSAKQAKDEIDKQSKALTDNATASDNNAKSKDKIVDANQRVADSAKSAAEIDTQSTQTQINNGNGLLSMMQNITTAIKAKMTAMDGLKVSTDQADTAFKQIMQNMGYFAGYKWIDFGSFADSMTKINQAVERQVTAFQNARQSATYYTQALSSQEVSVDDLFDAQNALNQATQISINGIVKMDKTTLDNLKKQIDSTKQKFDDLANTAKNTADDLEAELASLKGNDSLAKQLEQTRKLTELQEKLNEAKKRGNQEEITQYNRAIQLQQQLNAEETRQANEQKRQEQQAQTTQTATSSNNMISATDVANSFNDLIQQAREQGANDFAKQLQTEAKRLAR